MISEEDAKRVIEYYQDEAANRMIWATQKIERAKKNGNESRMDDQIREFRVWMKVNSILKKVLEDLLDESTKEYEKGNTYYGRRREK